MAEYTHTAKSILEQIILLKSRGLIIENEEETRFTLSNISYFRLSCYLRHFETSSSPRAYIPTTTFQQVVDLYHFDCQLRKLIFDGLQHIEIALRAKIVQHFSTQLGSFWYAQTELFHDRHIHQASLQTLITEVSRSKEDFILEYFSKYEFPTLPPAWKSLEVVSLGTLSKLYANLKDTSCKKAVAKELGLPKYDYLVSWMKSLLLIRNSCAHHSRIWNRRFAIMPALPAFLPSSWIKTRPAKPMKLYAQLCCIEYLLQHINPSYSIATQLKNLLASYPPIDLNAMGFPTNWHQETLWR